MRGKNPTEKLLVLLLPPLFVFILHVHIALSKFEWVVSCVKSKPESFSVKNNQQDNLLQVYSFCCNHFANSNLKLRFSVLDCIFLWDKILNKKHRFKTKETPSGPKHLQWSLVHLRIIDSYSLHCYIATFGLLGQGLSNSQECSHETQTTHTVTHTQWHTHSDTHTVTHTHIPDCVSLGVVELLIEEDERRRGHKSRVGRKGHTETTSAGVKGLVHIATRDRLKQK